MFVQFVNIEKCHVFHVGMKPRLFIYIVVTSPFIRTANIADIIQVDIVPV